MLTQLPTFILPSFVFLVFTFEHASSQQLWNPGNFVASCGSSVPPNWLCDPENILVSRDDGEDVAHQLASVNNDTNGEIYCGGSYYYGYIIAAAVVDTVEQEDSEDESASVQQFGKSVQKAWFGGRICDNSTVVVASLNTSRVLIFPGDATKSRLRSSHMDVCTSLRVDETNVTEGVMMCINALDEALEDALKPYANAPWGYAGVVVIMTMLIFHYWIKY